MNYVDIRLEARAAVRQIEGHEQWLTMEERSRVLWVRHCLEYRYTITEPALREVQAALARVQAEGAQRGGKQASMRDSHG